MKPTKQMPISINNKYVETQMEQLIINQNKKKIIEFVHCNETTPSNILQKPKHITKIGYKMSRFPKKIKEMSMNKLLHPMKI